MAAIILSAEITKMPEGFTDPLPVVLADLDDGRTGYRLFDFVPSECAFRPSEFVGLTVAEAMELKTQKDLAYIRG